jgi:hypothetical protein
MQSSNLLHSTVSSIERIVLCLACDRILLGRGGKRQFAVYKTPCCGECSCYGVQLFWNVLDMKARVRDTAAYFYCFKRNKHVICNSDRFSSFSACSLHREYPAIQRYAWSFYAVVRTPTSLNNSKCHILSRLPPISDFFLAIDASRHHLESNSFR